MTPVCGRFTLYDSPDQLARFFAARMDDGAAVDYRPSWNIAPTRTVLAVVARGDAAAPPTRELRSFRWGLVPSWAKDLTIGNKLFNARAETVPDKPAFRSAFRRRRCLVIADGFYEWGRPGEPSGNKLPYYFRRCDGNLLTFAGLWESWQPPGQPGADPPIRTCTVITTSANHDVEDIHDRMPVIVERYDWDEWLDPGIGDARHLTRLLVPVPASTLTRHPVDPAVNSSRNDNERLIRPYTDNDDQPATASDDFQPVAAGRTVRVPEAPLEQSTLPGAQVKRATT